MSLLDKLTGYKNVIISGGVCLAVGFVGGWTAHGWKTSAAQNKAVVKQQAAVIKQIAKQDKASDTIAKEHVVVQEKIRYKYRTLYRDAATLVPPSNDFKYALSVGLVRLHDAAATGTDPVPDPAGRPDDAPSDVTPSVLATTLVDNYEAATANAAQLGKLQDWVKAQIALNGD